ncbi:P-loop containing nucleoside triphosphate hydrolase protein, partial [Cercophora newfieldiana]
AHWIRNQGTNYFQAALNLHSRHRWCLTGTPIQNRLEDLLSLLKFLHYEPFSRASIFQKHILEPLSIETEDRTLKLKALLRTVCLRRSESLLHVPTPNEENIRISLRPEERSLYNEILQKRAIEMDDALSSQVKIKRYSTLFTAIMKLRRMCNHGTYSGARSAMSLDKTLESNPETETDCEFCGVLGEDSLELVSAGDLCPRCGRSLPQDLRGISPGVSQHSGEGMRLSAPTTPSNLRPWTLTNSSLVFSYWTTTLNILDQYFRARNTPFLRIDGTVHYRERLRILEEFRTSNVPILLMSIQTGAVGLNLTVASHVHIVEPQWNPSVEEQAVARAVRMGQTKRVTIFRYIVEDSVEEHIITIQKKKRNLAKYTLDSGSGETISGSLEVSFARRWLSNRVEQYR